MVEELALNRHIIMIDHVSNLRCLEMQKGAHWLVLLVGEQHSANVPSKLYEYWGANRPIIAIGPSGAEAVEMIKKTNTGIIADDRTMSSVLDRVYRGEHPFQPIREQMREYRLNECVKSVADVLNCTA